MAPAFVKKNLKACGGGRVSQKRQPDRGGGHQANQGTAGQHRRLHASDRIDAKMRSRVSKDLAPSLRREKTRQNVSIEDIFDLIPKLFPELSSKPLFSWAYGVFRPNATAWFSWALQALGGYASP